MNTTLRTLGCTAALATALAPASATVPAIQYEYNLSDFGGLLPFIGARVYVDATARETFVLADGVVRIFNASGMQTHSFAVDPTLGQGVDVVTEPTGDVLVGALTPKGFSLLRFDYRGTFRSSVALLLPAEVGKFTPSTMKIGPDGHLYLLQPERFTLTVVRTDGGFVRTIDLAPLLAVKDEERNKVSVAGFGFDGRGNLLVTMAERFAAYVIAPDGKVRDFGTAGSAPGRFGVIGPITGDADGNIYVADKQRSVVLVFDANLEFLTEFGGYGELPESLVRPQSVDVTADGRVLVSQMRQRGVSVFRVTFVPEQEVGATE